VLAAVGRRIADAVIGLGHAARVGADEFAVLLPGADSARARATAELVSSAASRAPAEGYEISCSTGHATYPEDATNAAALFQLAHGALYWAKRSGRACIRGYDPEQVVVVADEQQGEFAALIAEPGMVTVAFQPIVSLQTAEVVSWEALSRFTDDHRRLPSWWFEQAHRFGLGHRLEAEAVAQSLSVPGRPAGTSVSVNVSPSALTSEELERRFPDDMSDVVLEITEHEEITDEEGVHAALERLRARASLVDDAGAGYASLRQVMRLRAEIVKLDRELVQGLDADATKAALVASLVDFSHHTGATLCGRASRRSPSCVRCGRSASPTARGTSSAGRGRVGRC
jgi:EAL domain-containing protein (putative c-di-GMP-specific phosphodiesterase class I)